PGPPTRARGGHPGRPLGALAVPRAEPLLESVAGKPLRILVADPLDVRRAGLLLALHGRPWVEALAGARTLPDAIDAAERIQPHVALVGDPEIARALDVHTLLVRGGDGGEPGAILESLTAERGADAGQRSTSGSGIA